MISVPARGRLVLRAANGRSAELRALSAAPITDLEVIPVLASALALVIEEGTVELPTEQGLVYVPARLRDGGLELSVSRPIVPVQRRADVRSRIELPLHGTATPAVTTPGIRGLVHRIAVAGRTVDLSAGGLRAVLESPDLSDDLRDFYVELDGSGRRPVGAVLEAVALRSGLLQARFTIIAGGDREYLVRRVFEVQRAMLDARRNG